MGKPLYRQDRILDIICVPFGIFDNDVIGQKFIDIFICFGYSKALLYVAYLAVANPFVHIL